MTTEIHQEQIRNGREAVDAYRAAHAALYDDSPLRRSIPDEHTPLLEILLVSLKEQGFDSLTEFFEASDELNFRELGFGTRAEFNRAVLEGAVTEANEEGNLVTTLSPKGLALLQTYREMWH